MENRGGMSLASASQLETNSLYLGASPACLLIKFIERRERERERERERDVLYSDREQRVYSLNQLLTTNGLEDRT